MQFQCLLTSGSCTWRQYVLRLSIHLSFCLSIPQLKDELIQTLWSKVKATMNSHYTFLSYYRTIHIITMK